VLIAYIVFLTKLQRGKPDEMDLPLLKTISQVFMASDIYGLIAENTDHEFHDL